jgi:hypothetical protein
MTKNELITILTSKFYKVDSPTLQETRQNINKYMVRIFEKSGDMLHGRNINFYVENEGEVSEAAYWAGLEPGISSSQFMLDLDNYVNNLVSSGVIETILSREGVDIINETAIILAIEKSGNTLEERRYLIDKNAQGDLRHRQII